MVPIKTNFAMCIAGPSNSGKSSFCVNLLNNADRMFDKKFEKIYWILGDPKAKPQNLFSKVEYLNEVPEHFENSSNKPILYVLDDSMFETQNKNVANLFTRGCHHQNISVIFITQNIFHQSKYSRDISLNFSHICIMKNPRDAAQFGHLAKQLYPQASNELVRVYKANTEDAYSYLFIDLNQTTHSLLRFRTDIFNPDYLTIFCSKIPEEINNIAVENEMFGEESVHVTRFTPKQL